MKVSVPTDPRPSSGTARRPRVGLLTLHYGFNYGAVLQAFTAAKLFGGEIIDHRYVPKMRLYGRGDGAAALRDFIRFDLPLSPEAFVAEHGEHRATWRYAERAYDLLVLGSDELWKVDYCGRLPRRRAAKLLATHPYRFLAHRHDRQVRSIVTPFPNVYWPDVDVPIVGFAGSVGDTAPATIPARHRRKMAATVRRFCILGVRDEFTRRFFVEQLGADPAAVELVSDPVFSYRLDDAESSESRLRERLASVGVEADAPFVAVHAARNGGGSRRAEEAAAETGLPVVHPDRLNLAPPEWFLAYGLARFAIVDSMHPLIACLCQNTPCLSLDERRKSIELRDAFGINYETLGAVREHWPDDLPSRIDDRRRRTAAFVDAALATARGAAGTVDDPQDRRAGGMVRRAER